VDGPRKIEVQQAASTRALVAQPTARCVCAIARANGRPTPARLSRSVAGHRNLGIKLLPVGCFYGVFGRFVEASSKKANAKLRRPPWLYECVCRSGLKDAKKLCLERIARCGRDKSWTPHLRSTPLSSPTTQREPERPSQKSSGSLAISPPWAKPLHANQYQTWSARTATTIAPTTATRGA
jgi:hypothetical protein